jgi:glycosyltransferase involved in cell wall biosynthesis
MLHAPADERPDPAPRVSIIIPTHNRSTLLRRSIQSVLAQTFQDFELLVVDDASSDDTATVVSGFRDTRVRYIRLPENRRAAAARNVGIRQARGALLAFNDDDDVWLPHKLELQVDALQRQPATVGVNLCGHIKLNRDGATYVGGAEDFAAGTEFSNGTIFSGVISTPAWLVRSETFARSGLFDEGMKAWDDWELAMRMRDVTGFCHTEEPLFIQDQRRASGAGMWDNESLFANDLGIIMRKHGARWEKNPRVAAHHYRIMALVESKRGAGAESRRWFLKSLRAHPSIKALMLYLLSFFGPDAIVAARRVAGFFRPG